MQTASIGVSEPRCTITGAAGSLSPAIQGAGGGGFSWCNCANPFKTAVSLTSVGLSMRADLLQWIYMKLERRSVHKTDHKPI